MNPQPTVTDVQAFIESFQAESSNEGDQQDRVGANDVAVRASPSPSLGYTSKSSACLDEVVAQYVRTLSRESALHSFVVDMPSTVINLFKDHEDKSALNEALVTRAGERQKIISAAEEELLRLYDEAPSKVEERLSRGWQSVGAPDGQALEERQRGLIHVALHLMFLVYQRHHFELPQSASESFYLQILWGFFPTIFLGERSPLYRPGEVHSQSSALRKNGHRKAEGTETQAVGQTVDGLIVSSSTILELCVIEAANKDVGQNGTKALSDTRKIAKELKNTFDCVCAKDNMDDEASDCVDHMSFEPLDRYCS
ncbi:hypothetical protein DFQ27_000387 [Actinomortierella ambigua]|uniref:Uncharacterized protein n=1 Tax=Actinomortierella ambigua TaxID=1343610 RepID=A0A9P6QFZ1_9FUNG|nr:hypothetical protein DFQ27_000387 [Actinomortierella ambigua]